MDENSFEYKGWYVDYNLYGKGEYTIQYDGDDLWFKTPEEAISFIDFVNK